MPHEPAVRAHLRRFRLDPDDIDEVVQDCYCCLAALEQIDHIEQPRAYFLRTARNLVVRRLQRARIVPLEAYAEMDDFEDDSFPSPERVTSSKLAYLRMLGLMSKLPERCRRIVELRKLEGWSQKEIAGHLNISEKAVEKQVWLGVKAIQKEWKEESLAARDRLENLQVRRGSGL